MSLTSRGKCICPETGFYTRSIQQLEWNTKDKMTRREDKVSISSHDSRISRGNGNVVAAAAATTVLHGIEPTPQQHYAKHNLIDSD